MLWLALLAVLPACFAVVYDEGAWRAAGGAVLALFAAAALADLLLSRPLLRGWRAEAPGLLRATKGRSLAVPLSFTNAGARLPWVRYGLGLSPEFRVEGAVLGRIAPFERDMRVRADYVLRPLRRGRFFLGDLHAETPSRLRLWLLRRRFPLGTEVRVYPDLRAERRRLAATFLKRGDEGARAVRQLGKGREFEQLREYQPGDDYVDIDWKATARRKAPVTRTFQIERTQEIYVVVDHSRLSAREIRAPAGAGEEGEWLRREESAGGEWMVTTQLEKFLQCALVLASVAERQGDHFGFISFAEQVDRFIRGGNGKAHYNTVRDALYTLEPKPVAPDFEQLMVALRQRLTRRALLVMLVDLGDPLTSEQFFQALPLIHRQHLVLVNMVRPERARPLFSPQARPESVEGIYECLGGHFQWQELRETANRLRHLGVELAAPSHEALSAEVVSQYFSVKKRQLL